MPAAAYATSCATATQRATPCILGAVVFPLFSFLLFFFSLFPILCNIHKILHIHVTCITIAIGPISAPNGPRARGFRYAAGVRTRLGAPERAY